MIGTDSRTAWAGDGLGVAPMFGRERELAAVSDVLAGALEGQGALVTLVGEPGIGKSRLASEVSRLAAARGATIAWGRCWEGSGAPAFWPWIEVLRELVALADDAALAAAAGPAAGQLAALVPEIAQRLAITPAEPVPAGAGDAARFALFDAVAGFLARRSAGEPLVVLLDDLHVADPGSLVLLEFVTRALSARRVLLLGTYREHEMARRAEIAQTRGHLARLERRLALRGLRREDVVAFLRHQSGREPAEELVSAVLDTTEGNPFFVTELSRLLNAEGRLDTAGRLPLPAGVSDAIRARLAHLEAGTVAALQSASVIGRHFRLAILARALGEPPAAVAARLAPAVDLGMLREVGSVPAEYVFSHVLVRDVLYDDLGPTERAVVHLEVGRALEELYGSDAEPHLSELAHHFRQAVAVGDAEKAIDLSHRAGDAAMALAAYEEAVREYTCALDLLDSTAIDSPELRCDLLTLVGNAQARAGDTEGSRTSLVAAARLASTAGAARRMAQAVVGLGAVALPPGIVDREVVGLLEAALGMLDDSATDLRGRVLARLAVELYWSDDAERRRALALEADAIARGLQDPAERCTILAQVHLALSGADLDEDLERLEEVLDLARLANDRESEVQVVLWLVTMHLQLNDIAAADAHVEAFAALVEDLRQPRWEFYLPAVRSLRAQMDGRFDEADRWRAVAHGAADRVPGSMAPVLQASLDGGLRYLRGDLGSMVDGLGQFAGRFPGMQSWPSARILALVHAGRDAEARGALDAFAKGGWESRPRDVIWLPTMAFCAESAARLGATEHAETLYRLMTPFSGRAVMIPSMLYLGPVDRFLGQLSTVLGEPERALEHLAAAREQVERNGLASQLVLLDIAEAEARRARGAPGDHEQADEALRRAASRGARLGLEPRAEAARTALGDRAPQPANGPGRLKTARLVREGEIWTFESGGAAVRVRDGKGVRYLAVLLTSPDTEIHALDLVGGMAAGSTAPRAEGEELNVGSDDAGPLLDARAKREYRVRIAELREEVEEAESFNDPERAARAREELEFLGRELAGAVGLGGRDRKAASNAERARVNATRAIRSLLKRVAEHDVALGAELEATVRTGTFCSFSPDPRHPLKWEVVGG